MKKPAHQTFVIKPLIAAMLLPSAAVLAQSSGGIDEVTVTAEKREESLQSTPIAIAALSGDQLKDKGITSFEGVAQNSPSISLSPYPSSRNTLILFMRGQGQADAQQITQDGSVGLYVDGIYSSRPQASTFDLADVERVEVLRGPQGTLYGRNTTGGAVNIITKKPSGEFGLSEDLTYGSYNQIRSLTIIDLPKVGDFAAKFSYLRSRRDGTVENKGGNNDYNYDSQNAGRLAVRWDPATNFTADYALELGRMDSTPIYYQNPALNGQAMVICDTSPCRTAPYTYYAKDSRMTQTYRPVDLPLSDAENLSHSLVLTWDVSSDLTLKSLTGYRDLHSDVFQDYVEVFSPIVHFNPVVSLPLPYSTYDKIESHQFSQELQAIGNAGERVKYVGGLYYFSESVSHLETLDTGYPLSPSNVRPVHSSRDVSADAKSTALFGQITYTPPIFEDRFDITLGGRFTRDKRKADRLLTDNFGTNDIGSNDKTYTRFNPALTLAYRFNDDLNGYAKVATGYKAGGSSEAVPAGDFSQTFKPENVVNYELGLKSYLWDRRVRANMAAFYTKVSDLQMSFPIDPTNPSKVTAINAGRSHIKGIEADILVQPTDDLSVSLEYTGLLGYVDKVDPDGTTVYSIAGYTGNIASFFAASYVPRHKITTAVDYTLAHFGDSSVSTHVEYRWTSRFAQTQPAGPAEPGHDLYYIESYGLMDARVNLNWNDHWRFGVWGKNIFNKQYKSFVIGNADPINGKVNGGYTSADVAWADPATYGVDVSYKY